METRILKEFIQRSVREDLGDGDHTSLACVPWDATGKAELLIKEEGILAGINVAKEVFAAIDSDLKCQYFFEDGSKIKPGDVVLSVQGRQQSILKSERLVLNIMQRMSGIATSTRQYVDRLSGLKTKILDTRKTTPGLRFLEKEAVKIGGGLNHRMGLFDMIMLKDNHIYYAGGIEKAIQKTNEYLRKNNKELKIEIEASNLEDVRRIIAVGGINRIMLDNFNIDDTRSAIKLIDGRYETESSGKITLETVRSYAECGVDFISVGALTHHLQSLDMSLNAV
ncbi:MAG TPA: carboxylating nicotinate-nucleotide diphosphorylase [Bacteroidales bacterium]|nr:carboxylating nicotinate-nucleotide diphosphorylase [Bacteroidales bacterium]